MGISWFILLVSAHCVLAATEYYDSWSGETITEEVYLERVADNITFWCTNVIETCDETEGRRLDGSCNNLNSPQRGAPHTPAYSLLPEVFGPDYEPRLSSSGNQLPLARKIRTSIMANGRVSDTTLTSQVPNFLVFMGSDVTSGQDTFNYIFWRDCCSNPTDSECTIQEVPEDDPVHRFSGIRCLNLTRPWSFQSVGCEVDTATPKRSCLYYYGSILNDSLNARLYENGMLQYDMLNGKQWPPNNPNGNCALNQPALNETRCHLTPGTASNGLLGINLHTIWFYRNHNYMASVLAKQNPCWDDETLFQTAKDINIAIYDQILYYELFPTIMGRENMILDGVISKDAGFRDIYDDTTYPMVGMEFNTALRWIHTIQQGVVDLYSPEGEIVGELPYTSFRTGWLAIDDRLALVTQSVFRQPTAGIDQILDPDVAESGMGLLQRALDLLTNDLAKNRYFGHAPYVDYINFCEETNRTFSSFEDLDDYIKPEMIYVLKHLYEDVNDIDLQAGIWTEKLVEGGHVPKTFYCIVAHHLKLAAASDRHWYENSARPNAFSLEQLAEVRKVTISSILCLHGDTVTEIQPNAFKLISDENALTSCDNIPQIDLTQWTDSSCSA